ncbi:MAG: type I DNA topoisomerase [Gammaproteobacteria bacterium]
MPRSLVIVESPAKAKTISKYLGPDYLVKSSVGHIRDLPKKGKASQEKIILPKGLSSEDKVIQKKINERKRLVRRMGIDPDNSWAATYEIIPEKEKVIKELKSLAKKCDSVILATDLDREGEAIAWHLRESLAKENTNFSRVRFNQITRDSIQKAFKEPLEIDINLVNAQQARRFLDRVVGFELSPLLWAKIARNLSAGRVQSVALRLLAEREKKIKEFKPEEFWEISFTGSKDNQLVNFSLVRTKSESLLKEAEAKHIEKLIVNSELKVSEVIKKPTTSKPKAPFITSTLQQAASTKLGYTVSRTMRAAQKLYENGLITYMRTDAPSLSKESIQDARAYIENKFGQEYLTNAPRIYSSKENAQEAHEAIRPTNAHITGLQIHDLRDDEIKLYDLIWEQFIACQLPDAEFLSTSVFVDFDDYKFQARGREILFDGFLKVYKQKDSEEDQKLPSINSGDVMELDSHKLDKKFTKPSARFSEAALVKELEKRGIGRPSTYANIISTIQDRGYAEIINRRFFVNKIGMIVSDRLIENFDDIMDYNFTANFENRLDDIANGEANWLEVLNEYYKAFQEDLEQAMHDTQGMRRNNPVTTSLICPDCNSNNLNIRNSATGVFLSCSGYSTATEYQCKKTLNLISGEEAVSIDDQQEAVNLIIKRRCPKCDLSMDNYLIDDKMKIHVCSNNPDCDGIEIEEGVFKLKGYDGPTLDCHKCGAEMELKTGRFGKYFACNNNNCDATRRLQRNGEPYPIYMDPIPLPELQCSKVADHFLLRDSLKGLFLAASRFPKNRETRAPAVTELKLAKEGLPDKHRFLLTAPDTDDLGNPFIIRYNKTEDTHYLSSERDGKKIGTIAIFENNAWKIVSKK